MPFSAVWEEYLNRCVCPVDYLTPIREYEAKIIEVRK